MRIAVFICKFPVFYWQWFNSFLELLSKKSIEVDFFAFNQPKIPNYININVINYSSENILSDDNILKIIHERTLIKQYDICIGFEYNGLFFAEYASKIYDSLLGYYSCELFDIDNPNAYKNYITVFTNYFKESLSNIDILMIQDKAREDQLYSILNTTSRPKSVLHFPVSLPKMNYLNENTDYFHKKYSLAPNTKILLYIGGIRNDRFINELTNYSQLLPENYVTIIHGHTRVQQKIINDFDQLNYNKKVILSIEDFGDEIIFEMVRSCDIGFVFYSDQIINEYLTGRSSSKLALYLSNSKPVICPDFPTFSNDIMKYHYGKTLNKWENLTDIFVEIMNNYQYYKNGAIKIFEEVFNQELYIDRLEKLIYNLNVNKQKCTKQDLNNDKFDAIANIKRRNIIAYDKNEKALELLQISFQNLYNYSFNSLKKDVDYYKTYINYDVFFRHFNNTNKSILLSVIIVAYNTNNDLINCVESLLPQLNDNVEIIIVDNGGNDEVLQQLFKFRINYICCPINLFPSEGRNVGVHFAKGEIVAFLDDDGIAGKNWVQNILKAFKEYDLAGLRGKVLPKNKDAYIITLPHYDLGDEPINISYIDTEGNSAFLKSIYTESGGMDPLLFGGEGFEMSYRFKRDLNNCKIAFIPSVIIYHDYAISSDKNEMKQDRHKLMNDFLRYKYFDIEQFRIPIQSQLVMQTNKQFSKSPFISICIPTYNRTLYIGEAIQSALNQNYDNYEIVIVDDGSTDSTKEMVDSFNSEKIRYIYQKNSGRPKARNRLINEAKGDYVLWLDSDDVLGKNILDEYLNVSENYNPEVIYCNIEIKDKFLQKSLGEFNAPKYGLNSDNLLQNLIKGTGLTFPGSLMKRELLMKVGMFNEEFSRAQDNELWTRLANKVKFHKVDKVLYYYRKHDDNISLNDVIDKSYESLVIRNIIKTNTLSTIFPDYDFNNEKLKDKALLEIAIGLFKFEDYYNTINLLNNINFFDDKFAISIYVRSLIGLGDYKKAKVIINKYRNSNQQIFYDLDNTIDILILLTKIEIKSSNAKIIQDIVNRVTQTLQFIPSEIYLLNARVLSLKNELENSFNYYKKVIGTSPENTIIFNEAIEIGKKLNKENEIYNLKNRMLRPIEFFEYTKNSTKSSPLVSVIIPTYNRPDYLRNAIKSVLNQSFQNYEVIVINDSGIDVEYVFKELNDSRIKYFRHETNKGLAASRNTGIINAFGEYIAYLDDDDIYYPNHLEVLVKYAINFPQLRVFYSDSYQHSIIKKGNELISLQRDLVYSYDYSQKQLLYMNIAPVLCFMHERSLVEECGFFDEKMTTHEDWEFWLRLSNKSDFQHIKEITSEYRRIEGEESMTNDKLEDFLKTMKIIFNKFSDNGDKSLRQIRNKQLANLKNRIIKNVEKISQKTSTFSQLVQVSIIIPVFNKSELTKNCIESLYNFTSIKDFELIIVDNGSTDDTVNVVHEFMEKYSNIKYLKNSENLGYAKANNKGARLANYEYILLLNNDTIVTQGWLEPLIDIVKNDKSVAAVGSKLLFPNEKIQHAGVAIVKDIPFGDHLVARHLYYGYDKSAPEVNELREYQALTGACLLIRKSNYFDVGGLDEEYWNAYEDVDLCFKLREKGYKLVYQPKSVVYHLESQSGPERLSGVENSVKRLHSKWLDKIIPDFTVRIDKKVYITNNEIKIYNAYHNAITSKSINLASIIVLTYNSSSTIENCLNSVINTLRVGDEVIIVDNNSRDNTIEIVESLIGNDRRFIIIQNNENIGFSAGTNVGIRLSKNPVVVMLNPDTIVNQYWLNNLTAKFDDKSITAVGPVSNRVAGHQRMELYPKDDLTGWTLPDVADYFNNKFTSKTVDTKLLIGFCMAVRREFIEKFGGLDENLFLGNDDLELSWRIRLNGGKLAVALDTFVFHVGQASFKTEVKSHTDKLVQESTDALYRKLVNHYGDGNVPPPMELWGIDWFKPSNPNYELSNTKISPKSNKLTSIIILAKDQYEYTKECIDSIFKYTAEPYELILVDNGSRDNIPDYFNELQQKYSNVEVITNHENVGFPKGVNQGIRASKGKYILIGNNDTIVTPGWLAAMIYQLEKSPKNGIVGPMSNNISGLQLIKDLNYSTLDEMLDYAKNLRKNNYGQVISFPRVAFFCTLIKREVIDKIGGLDERFSPGNYEDDDFCMRAQIAGFETHIMKDLFIHHYRSRSFVGDGNDAYQQRLIRNRQIFVDKWGGTPDEIWIEGKRVNPPDLFVPL